MTRFFFYLFGACISFGLLKAQDLTPEYSNSKHAYGYVNSEGKKVIPYRFNQAEPFHDGKAIVSIDSKSGIIDVKGKAILPFEYNDLKYVESAEPVYIVTDLSKKKGLMNKDLQMVIPCDYQKLIPDNKVLIFSNRSENDKPLYGLMDFKGKILIECINKELIKFNDGMACLLNVVNGSERYGIIKNTGEIVIPFEYGPVTFKGSLILAQSADLKKLYLFKREGKKLSDEAFDEYKVLSPGWYTVKNGSKWGVLSENGAKSSIDFDEVISESKISGIIVKKSGKMGVLNHSARLVIPCEFETIPSKAVNGRFILKKGNAVGCIDTTGTTVIPFTLSESGVKSDYAASLPVIKKLLLIDPSNDDVLYLDCLGRYTTSNPTEVLAYIAQLIAPYEKQSPYMGPQSLQYFRCLAYTDLKDFVKAKEARFNIQFGDCGSYWVKSSFYLGNAMFKSGEYLQASTIYRSGNIYGKCDELEKLKNNADLEAKNHGMEQPTLQLGKKPVTPENEMVWEPEGEAPFPGVWPYKLKDPASLINGHFSQITGLDAHYTQATCGCDFKRKSPFEVSIYCFASYTSGMKNISESTTAFEMRVTDYKIIRIERSTNSFIPGYLIFLDRSGRDHVVVYNPKDGSLRFKIDQYELEKTGNDLVWGYKFGNY